MKNKNKRDLEKYWAEQAAKKARLARKRTAAAEKTKPDTDKAGKASSESQSAD